LRRRRRGDPDFAGCRCQGGKADAAVTLGGKPEFLAADGKGKVFINLEDKNQVAVVDTKTMKVVNKWSTSPGGAPVGMSMDREHHRLFIGCRNPQKLIIMDRTTAMSWPTFRSGRASTARDLTMLCLRQLPRRHARCRPRDLAGKLRSSSR